ncbi:MAG: HAMP domain-containing histidine kinase [Bacteroidetes bacterium]|nr:HAMP domain-containing histidine kinase [Bacteroidota bacterium]
MKKNFIAIIILILLSLFGIILIQVQWLSNLLLVQEESIYNKIERASYVVTSDLSKQVSTMPSLHLKGQSNLPVMPDHFSFVIPQDKMIADYYTSAEIHNKIRKAFNKEKLDNLEFEFAIANRYDQFGTIEMQSQNFLKKLFDSTHSRRIEMPILPDNSESMEGLSAYEHLILVIPDFKTQVWKALAWMIIGAILFTLVVLTAFYLTVRTLIQQRKLSAIKSDFINNMTHELKTPLATISLAVDALRNEKVMGNAEKSTYFSGIIKEENKRMNKHVETILQAGLMDRQDIRMSMELKSAHQLIRDVLSNYELQLTGRNATVDVFLNAKNDRINADEVHFSNLVSNLVDNAIKYSKDNIPLHLKITTHSTTKNLVIQFEDNGIGMSKETSKRIFEKFFRATTGNVHNVKGFGLGMSYVKTIIDAHKGRIKVDSVLGKGSTFIIDLPLGNVNQNKDESW